MHQSTKTYGHDLGLSVCFRQWRAASHCSFLHGYALAVALKFEADTLDERNWVMDFGGLKPVKAMLENTFDHTLLVAQDDPHLEALQGLERLGIAQVVVVPATGCEAFAQLIFNKTLDWLRKQGTTGRVRLVSVEVREHGANSGIYVAPHQIPLHTHADIQRY